MFGAYLHQLAIPCINIIRRLNNSYQTCWCTRCTFDSKTLPCAKSIHVIDCFALKTHLRCWQIFQYQQMVCGITCVWNISPLQYSLHAEPFWGQNVQQSGHLKCWEGNYCMYTLLHWINVPTNGTVRKECCEATDVAPTWTHAANSQQSGCPSPVLCSVWRPCWGRGPRVNGAVLASPVARPGCPASSPVHAARVRVSSRPAPERRRHWPAVQTHCCSDLGGLRGHRKQYITYIVYPEDHDNHSSQITDLTHKR